MPARAHVELTGNVGGDPEIRKLPRGGEVISFSLAVNQKDGKGEDITMWFRASCFFERLIDVIDKYVRKGDQIQVAGRFMASEWEDREGNTRTSLEVNISDLVLIQPPPDGARGSGRSDDRGGGRSDDRGGRSGDRGGDRGTRGDDRGGRGGRGDDRGAGRSSERGGRTDDRGGARGDDRGARGAAGSDRGGRGEDRGARGGGDGGGAASNSRDLDDDAIPF